GKRFVRCEARRMRITARAAHAVAADAQALACAAVAARARDRVRARLDAVQVLGAARADPSDRVRARVLRVGYEQTLLLMTFAAIALVAVAARADRGIDARLDLVPREEASGVHVGPERLVEVPDRGQRGHRAAAVARRAAALGM